MAYHEGQEQQAKIGYRRGRVEKSFQPRVRQDQAKSGDSGAGLVGRCNGAARMDRAGSAGAVMEDSWHSSELLCLARDEHERRTVDGDAGQRHGDVWRRSAGQLNRKSQVGKARRR